MLIYDNQIFDDYNKICMLKNYQIILHKTKLNNYKVKKKKNLNTPTNNIFSFKCFLKYAKWLPKGIIFKLEFSLLIVQNLMKVAMLKFTLGNLTI